MSKAGPSRGKAGLNEWMVVISEESLDDEAVRVCLEDLMQAGEDRGLSITITQEEEPRLNMIVVGDVSRSRLAGELQKRGIVKTVGVENPEGYEIITEEEDGRMIVAVAGGSLMGDVYGLYRIWDRLRVTGRIPAIDLREEPDLEIRYTRIRVKTEEDIRRALRYRLNMVYGENPLNLISWDCNPEDEENCSHREETRRLAEYAHSLHMKFLSFGTEFTYHPSLIEEFGASLSPSDPRLWDAVRAKFRRLLEVLPELDGVATFTGEEQSYWDPYNMFDVIHEGEGCDWSLEKRYRTFVKAVWDVVVGEFDKLLVHRTWNTTAYEQQSQPDVYKRTFTDEVPTRNLYLVPSFTQNDRWWFQAYNPTFNLTPHHMMAVFESMDYHDGGKFFPTYPGVYFQAGLDSILGVGKGNLKGGSMDMPAEEGWDTRSLTAYTVARLMWNHHEDPEEIARDYCAINFGEELTEAMAEILMLSPIAYKYGLYIEPVVYGAFSSLPHIRTGRFVAEGYPSIDGGKEHLEFLRRIYLRCKPWIDETIMYLDNGLRAAKCMEEKFAAVKHLIKDRPLGEGVENSLRLTTLLIETSNLYVKTFISYFRYREEGGQERREALQVVFEQLKATRKRFVEIPGHAFRLFGVDELAKNVELALEDLGRAEEMLATTPSTCDIEKAVQEQQRMYDEILHDQRDRAVKVLYWEGRVDGRDILSIGVDELGVEHLRWDPIYVQNHVFYKPLPRKAGSVVTEDIESEPMHPFVLEQPKEENGYVARIYLHDVPGGAHWVRFNLYFIDESPEKLGLKVPWD